jgi:membrane AbrB-like protein
VKSAIRNRFDLPPPDWPNILWQVIAVLAALVGGFAAYVADVPLAWVLGPLVVTAALSVSGVNVWSSTRARRFGQLIIGTGLGLNITAALLLGIGIWIPAMIATAFGAIIITSAFSVFVQRFGRLDRTTAYFAMMPGGLSEMANVGARVGARVEPIALAQAVRIGFVVPVLPPAIIALDIHGDFLRIDDRQALGYPEVAALLVMALAGVWLMNLLQMANPWMLGALVTTAVLTSAEFVSGQMPRIIFYGGQFLLGIAIGARFRRDIISRLPRLFILMALFTLLISLTLFAYGAGLSWLTGIDLATAALASSAGGVVEMALTAQILQLNVAMVLGFHVVRAIMVNGVSIFILNLLNRVGFFSAIERFEVGLLGARPKD